jgi:hypothetical protein
MPRLQTDGVVLEDGIWKGPSNTNYVDMIMTDDALRSQTSSRSNKYWTAEKFDFPTLYEVNEPVRVQLNDPISTYAMYQSQSYAQRYGGKK